MSTRNRKASSSTLTKSLRQDMGSTPQDESANTNSNSFCSKDLNINECKKKKMRSKLGARRKNNSTSNCCKHLIIGSLLTLLSAYSTFFCAVCVRSACFPFNEPWKHFYDEIPLEYRRDPVFKCLKEVIDGSEEVKDMLVETINGHPSLNRKSFLDIIEILFYFESCILLPDELRLLLVRRLNAFVADFFTSDIFSRLNGDFNDNITTSKSKTRQQDKMLQARASYSNICVVVPVIPKHLVHLDGLLNSIANQTQLPRKLVLALSETDSETCSKLQNKLDEKNRLISSPLVRSQVEFNCTVNKAYWSANIRRGYETCKTVEFDVLSIFDADDQMFPTRLATISRVLFFP